MRDFTHMNMNPPPLDVHLYIILNERLSYYLFRNKFFNLINFTHPLFHWAVVSMTEMIHMNYLSRYGKCMTLHSRHVVAALRCMGGTNPALDENSTKNMCELGDKRIQEGIVCTYSVRRTVS
jgi:hypothetical protein